MFNPLLLTKYGLYLYHNPLESSDDVLTLSGEDGIRTHVALPPNGFQDRLVMTASIPLQKLSSKRSASAIIANTADRVKKNLQYSSTHYFIRTKTCHGSYSSSRNRASASFSLHSSTRNQMSPGSVSLAQASSSCTDPGWKRISISLPLAFARSMASL